MAFVLKRILDRGGSHPVVARVFRQTHDLLEWSNLPQEKTDQLKTIYLDLTKRILKIDDLVGRLIESLKNADQEMTDDKASGRTNHLPQIMGIEGEVETFLYEAKNILRTLLNVINIAFDMKFKEASAFYDTKGDRRGKVVVWATKELGPDHNFTKMLITEQPWVADLIQRRNAVEHPGELSGWLHIDNITLHASGKMIPPLWRRNDGPGYNLIADLETGLINLCTFAEDVLVEVVRHTFKSPVLGFFEIPVAERDPECPVRIKVGLDPAKVKWPGQ
jgi:hypothetical protein